MPVAVGWTAIQWSILNTFIRGRMKSCQRILLFSPFFLLLRACVVLLLGGLCRMYSVPKHTKEYSRCMLERVADVDEHEINLVGHCFPVRGETEI